MSSRAGPRTAIAGAGYGDSAEDELDDRGPLVSELQARKRRRLIMAALLRALLTATLLTALYYALPMDENWHLSAGVRLVVGLVVMVAVITWQIRTVLRSSYPGIRAVEALAVTVPFFLLFFASTYVLMSSNGSGHFSQENLSRTDSLYFAVTTFATVGYGDITATSQSARLVVTFQMILDLLILGVGIRAFVGAVRLGQQRRAATENEVGLHRTDSNRARRPGTSE
jgi:voltage-gated potassium channel